MDCSVCLNLQNDGICTRFGKEPPAGFAARCRHYAPDPDAPTPAEPEPEPEPASSTATCDGTDRTTDRLCRTEPCPYLDAPYCISGVRAEAGGIIAFSHTLLQDDSPCPRNWTA